MPQPVCRLSNLKRNFCKIQALGTDAEFVCLRLMSPLVLRVFRRPEVEGIGALECFSGFKVDSIDFRCREELLY